MKLTLIGIYGPYPAPGKGCSSYLVEDGETKILLDCGSGSLSRYRALFPGDLDLNAIVLSHMHADHAGEIDLFRYMLEFGHGKTPLPVLAPELENLRSSVFAPVRTEDGTEVSIGSLSLRFFAVSHAVSTMGVRITGSDGHSLFYTGDTGWFEGLCDAAKDADLLLADACLWDESNPKALKNHMTVRQIETLRKRANCKRAVLTHRFGDAPDELPALEPFCEHAIEGAVYEI